MLGRIPRRRLDVLNLRPIINRYFAPTYSHRNLLSDSPAAAAAVAAKDRRWVMLNSNARRRPDDPSFVGDANTVAESRSTKGRRVRVSLRCAVPPSSSDLYYDFPAESSNDPLYDDEDRIRVVAAHGELVLLQMHNTGSFSVEDYFMYRLPAGTRRPSSLTRLPVLEPPTKPESVVPASYFDPPSNRCPRLDSGVIGLLRRGEKDVLVVHVDLCNDLDPTWEMAVISVLRPGMRRWELVKPVPVFERGIGRSSLPGSGNVICIGERFICCIWYDRSFLLFDMADEASPKVCLEDLPPEVFHCSYGYDGDRLRVRRMGAAGDSSVRLVSIQPYCCRSVDPDRDLFYSKDRHYYKDCCGCLDCGTTDCWHPRFVFTIKTWTMNLKMDEPLEWVQDGEMDSEEIWALPGYEGLPTVIPEWPVVCLDKPNVVCFVVSNDQFTKGIAKKWMVQLNITTKTLLSVVLLTRNNDYSSDVYSYHLPAEFQY